MSKLKVKMLSRNPDEYIRETKRDIFKMPRNYDPNLHPLELPREYTRALNATKLERVFAKPFLGSLDGHGDGINCLAKHPKSLSTLMSGACDGEIRLWNLATRECVRTITAHDGFVRGISAHPSGKYFFSCGDDQTIKQWSLDTEETSASNTEPMNTILGKHGFYGIDHHQKKDLFVTCGESVDVWDETRSQPMRTFKWGVDSVTNARFNPIETYLLGATASDRSVLLYDMRGATPLRKVVLSLRSNTIAWNPMEAFIFTVANEDYNLYTFDMRRLNSPICIHMDHTSAVLDVDYSPTGKEFVSGSYDKTIRIFPVDKGHSREVYHTKRMQRVMNVKWSLDDKYIMSASDEMNIRVWKARASEKLGILKIREKTAFNYGEKLKEKFSHHPQIKRINRHRHVPKSIYAAQKEHRIIKDSKRRKEQNVRAHSKPGTVPFVSAKKKTIVEEKE
ncbi:DDB1- and CUL4-associated factor 13-like [Tubulanus polymorphus]|uniref:DDB1- and CUL4-associated factor 13-like n=1 Tax=Tubulanus polymorphus TaxID=672921 RepID=UPI003DA43101